MSLLELSTFLGAEGRYSNGLTATLIHTTDLDAVIEQMFPPDAARYPSIDAIEDEMFDRFDVPAVATVHRVDDWACVREDIDWQGTKPRITTQLSAVGTYLCAAQNSLGVGRFLQAIGGQIVRNFEPLFQERERGSWYGEPLPEEANLAWSTYPLASALTLQARLAGVITGDPTEPYLVLCYDGLTGHGHD